VSPARRRLIALGASLLLLFAAGVAGLHSLRWRAVVVGMKVAGKIPDLGWGDLFHMLPPRSGYYLEPLTETGNPYSAIENPYTSAADSAAGAAIFRLSCTQCHEGAARGAPDLMHAALKHPSDWALYRVLAFGIPGTPMISPALGDRERWQVIDYIRSSRRGVTIARGAVAAVPAVPVSAIATAGAHPDEWLTYSGSYESHRFSPLRQISRANAKALRAVWMFQPPEVDEKNEASPLVAGGVMYLTAAPNTVWALDARTGAVLWHYTHPLQDPLALCCSTVNRGVALLDSLVFVGTLDAQLLALDAGTGHLRWKVAVADPALGYSITGAPLATPEGIITGVGGGEFGASGIIDAYDPHTGKRRWRFHAIPQPGDSLHDTWTGDSWKTGGAPTWLTGAYDTATHVVYWGVGNPGPNYAGATRPGSNLYSNSVVALDARTGHLKWYFQFTPHDEHDWDAAQIPVLVNAPVAGRLRHLLLWANRNGFYYVLDRDTGAFLHGTAFERQTWAAGLDSSGTPIPLPGISPSDSGTFLYPSVVGATNWWSPSFDDQQKLMLIPALHLAGTYYLDRQLRRGDLFTGGAATQAFGQPFWNSVKALDPITGSLRWEYRFPPHPENVAMGGITSTAGGLVLAGDGPTFAILDAANGKELWSFTVGGTIAAAPVVFAVDGQERIALMAGRTLVVFGLSPR